MRLTLRQLFGLLGRYRERQREADIAVGRIQQTLVNLQIDTEKQESLPLTKFLTMYHPMLKFNKSQVAANKEDTDLVPKWKREMNAMKAWTTGTIIRTARGG